MFISTEFDTLNRIRAKFERSEKHCKRQKPMKLNVSSESFNHRWTEASFKSKDFRGCKVLPWFVRLVYVATRKTVGN